MKTLRSWEIAARHDNGVDLRLEGRHLLRIRALEEDLFRVSLLKDGAWRLDRTWCIAPGNELPWEGRPRDSDAGFACPRCEISEGAALILSTPRLRLTISQPLHLRWSAWHGESWRDFVEERLTGGLMLGTRDHRHAHFLRRTADEPVHGLGEKAGDLNRAGRRFEMRNLDAMGYDAERTDPLYKHTPFTLTQTAQAGAWSIYYDTLAPCWFDLGQELDNYHAPYRSFRAEDGDLDYYLRWAPRLAPLVTAQERMTGGTAFPPRWSLGYSGSTMRYTDAEDAQAQLEGFLDEITARDIPCDSFQMSSGYTSIGDKRYVFHWNNSKMPDVEGMCATFAKADVHLIANIKPCLLRDHPRYDEVAQAGLFIRDSETDAPERSSFWDDEGSHLDFTNPATIAWWQRNVTTQLLERGIGSTWNDNNEYEVWDRGARCAGFGREIEVDLIRPLMPLLMARASEEAQRAHAPGLRPYLISRSGAPGLGRHAQTWSGDNRTEWKTLRYNQRMGLGMSLSGYFNIGHDVGGFAGPRPEPELFLRWVQNGIFHPRFTIHSWNDDGTVNEPWMHPEVTDLVRAALRLRYRLLPYLYTALWRAAQAGEPILRPLFLDHPDDAACWDERDEFMLGRDLLVAPVLDPGATQRVVQLPQNGAGWYDFWTGIWQPPGAQVTLPVTLESMPLFVRAGTVLPLACGAMRADPGAETAREWHLFPGAAGTQGSACVYDDDGVSEDPAFSLIRFALTSDAEHLRLSWTQEGTAPPPLARARLVLPEGDRRSLLCAGHEQPNLREVAL